MLDLMNCDPFVRFTLRIHDNPIIFLHKRRPNSNFFKVDMNIRWAFVVSLSSIVFAIGVLDAGAIDYISKHIKPQDFRLIPVKRFFQTLSKASDKTAAAATW